MVNKFWYSIFLPRRDALLCGGMGAVAFLFLTGMSLVVFAVPSWAQNGVLAQVGTLPQGGTLPQVGTLPQGGTQPLLDRLDRLERDIRTLNRQVARIPSAVAPPVTSAASTASAAPVVTFTSGETPMSRVLVRMTTLESEVRATTGMTEKLTYRVDQLTTRLDKLIKDLDYRLARLEGGARPLNGRSSSESGTSPAVSPAPVPQSVSKIGTMALPQGVLGTIPKTALENIVTPKRSLKTAPAKIKAGLAAARVSTTQPPASVLPAGTAKERYRFAFNLMRQARYDEAEGAFKAFVAAYGDNPLSDNARYWLGETYYVRKRYMDAAQAFFAAYKKAPKGVKAADSLLKLGMSLDSLEKPKEACTTFSKLHKEFSPLKNNIKSTLDKEMRRLKCQ